MARSKPLFGRQVKIIYLDKVAHAYDPKNILILWIIPCPDSLCPNPEICRHGPPTAVQNTRGNSSRAFADSHRARAPAIEKHPVFGP